MNKRFLVYFLIANLYFAASQLPLLTFVTRTPPDRFFPLYHTNSWYDYNTYLAAVTQGKAGAWRMGDPYTTEPTNPTLFYVFYILVGKAAAVFNLPSFAAYHGARIVAVELYILALYYLCAAVLGKKYGVWGAILGIIGTIAPIPLFNEPEAFKTYTPWWAELDAFKRLDTMPHYLAGYAILFFLAACYVKGSFHWMLPLLSLFAAVTFPPSMLPIVAGAILMRRFLPVGAAAMIGLTLIWRENANGFPWDYWNSWERTMWNQNPFFNRAMVLGFGILPLLAIPTVIKAIRQRFIHGVFLSVWAFLPYLLLPFIDILGFSKYRIMTVAPFAPMAILTTQTLLSLKRLNLLRLAAVATMIPVSVSLLINNVRAAKTFPLYPIMFIPNDFMAAVRFLERSAPQGSVILTDKPSGSVIPAYAPVVSNVGHDVHTKDFPRKKDIVARFFRYEIAKDQARMFLVKNGIEYVVAGLETNGRVATYPFLQPVFIKGDYTVYTIQP